LQQPTSEDGQRVTHPSASSGSRPLGEPTLRQSDRPPGLVEGVATESRDRSIAYTMLPQRLTGTPSVVAFDHAEAGNSRNTPRQNGDSLESISGNRKRQCFRLPRVLPPTPSSTRSPNPASASVALGRQSPTALVTAFSFLPVRGHARD